MIVTTKNLSHAKLMLIEETQKFIKKDDANTTMVTKARITSNLWGPLCSRIESIGLKKMREGTKNVRYLIIFFFSIKNILKNDINHF